MIAVIHQQFPLEGFDQVPDVNAGALEGLSA
jgi:hypothetical protein